MKKLQYELWAGINSDAKDKYGNYYNLEFHDVKGTANTSTVEVEINDNLSDKYIEESINEKLDEIISEMKDELYKTFEKELREKFRIYFDEHGDWSDSIYPDWSMYDTHEYIEFLENVIEYSIEGPFVADNKADFVVDIK